MSSVLTDTLRRLDAVQRELLETPRDDWERRQDLHDLEAALRAELRQIGRGLVDDLSIEQLKRRIAVAEGRISDHYGLRMSHTSGAQSWGGGGTDPRWLHEWHRRMDKSADLEGMRTELAVLREQLAKLEGRG